jgi:hypothetical protein
LIILNRAISRVVLPLPVRPTMPTWCKAIDVAQAGTQEGSW